MPESVKCESVSFSSGLQCHGTASWIVAVGTRKTDAQRSCSLHLSRVCRAMYEAEGRNGAVLTVGTVSGEPDRG